MNNFGGYFLMIIGSAVMHFHTRIAKQFGCLLCSHYRSTPENLIVAFFCDCISVMKHIMKAAKQLVM